MIAAQTKIQNTYGLNLLVKYVNMLILFNYNIMYIFIQLNIFKNHNQIYEII